MERTPLKFKDKKGAGLATSLIGAIGALVIVAIVTYVVVDTMIGAELYEVNRVDENSTDVYNTSVTNLGLNLTSGVDEVAAKIPTILLIAAVVVLFGAIVLLVQRSSQMSGSSGGGI